MQAVLEQLRDSDRLRDIDAYSVFGTAAEADYDHIVRLTAELFDAPVALINFVGAEEVWVKSRFGIDVQSVPCEVAFCSHTVLGDQPMVVPDLSLDRRFANNPMVTGGAAFRFYAGAPLKSAKGYGIGTLCIIDTKVRPPLDETATRRLQDLARLVTDKLEQRRLSRLEVISAKLMSATADAVVVADGDRRIVAWNHSAETVFGYRAEDVLGEPLAKFLPLAIAEEGDAAMSGKPGAWRHRQELKTQSKSHHEITVEVSGTAWQDERLNLSGLGFIIRDVTEQRLADSRIAFLAHHDELTGLHNRNSLHRLIEDLLSQASGEVNGLAVVCIDLDRFKLINETLGHKVGDALLQQVADRLRAIAGHNDILARLGGDEFAIVRRGGQGREALALFAETILAALAETFDVGGHLVSTSASLGIACHPRDGRDCDTLLNHADLATYRTKLEGRNGFHFFEKDMDGQTLVKRGLENDLRGAQKRDEFEIHYQPQFDIATGALVGAEALLRWKHPDHGYISPAEFIPIAETTGLMVSIGRWAFHKACHDFATLPPNLGLAINLSPVQFRRDDIPALVSGALAASGLPSHRLEIEITESLLMERDAGTLDALNSLKAMGVDIALDDFGTGYSSLSYLHSFPFDKIKIDRSFVKEADTNNDCAAILQAMAALATALKLTTVAEGIETEQQLARVKALGYHRAQGFLLARPQPIDALAALTQARPFNRLTGVR
ncbi:MULTISPECIES: sensor domain-containing phosphodiesterase [Alphaproteobacteria]|uniref:Bifunctional diguanylate cyclase/phosphodiesterase n=2 Tax=Alphaproteobacteria TaxID=28211 RepID=A0A512HEJ3_9HYPH|nr:MULTISPECIES: EAL domain-containing protein [Alphaproteobacteria]GEO83862.1 bifunctional diguanylate cyclase/phosphodiesterase [Ciceribacter naphthalenivorans]GLR21260.1 bifunctional diguanylate cyclase/phosphodiesterase [Ciceribacter naphthalenivorans]GLT04116.1 bifunctional diguanylate cyclase/phosphodiesterase [Sphingomonas psychrolutea]